MNAVVPSQTGAVGTQQWVKANENNTIFAYLPSASEYLKARIVPAPLAALFHTGSTGISLDDGLSLEDMQGIEEGLKDIEEGRVYSHEDARKMLFG